MKQNDVIVFVPYGSRLGFHLNGIASTMANIDYKFPQCVCYEDCDEQDKLSESMGHPKQAHCNSGRNIRSTVCR